MAETDEAVVVDRSKWMNVNNGVTQTTVTDEPPAEPATEPVVDPVQTEPATQATEPVTTQVTNPTPSQFDDIWKKEFGDADVNSVKDAYGKYKTILPEYETLKAQPPVSPYKTEGGKQIDEWLAKGVKLETIARFNNVKPETLNTEEAIKLKMEIENPAWSRDIIDAYYQTTYKHVADDLKSEEINALEAKIKEGAVLKAEAEAKAFLTDYLGKQFNPSEVMDATAKQREEAATKAGQFWTGQSAVLSNAVKGLNQEFKLKVMGEKGEQEVKLPFSFSVPEAEQKQLLDYALNSAVQSGVELTENGIKQVTDFVRGTLWAKYGESIARSAVEQALSEQHKHFSKIIHNPTTARTDAPNYGASPTREAAWKEKLGGGTV